MAIRLTRVSTGEDFDFGPDVDERSRELGDLLHHRTTRDQRAGRERVECRMHDDSANPELAARRGSDGRVHGIYVALVKLRVGASNEIWTVCHFDRTASHIIRVGEGDEHRREKGEWCTAFGAAGYPTDTEIRIPSGAICDVLVEGPAGRFDVEVQRYHQTVPHAKGRTTRIRRGGVEPVWSASRLTPWNEGNVVPNVRTNDLSEALSSSRPIQDEWIVVGGARRTDRDLCHPRFGTSCPVMGPGRFCGKEHPRLEPLPGLRVYEVAERLPAGDLIVVRIARNGSEVLMSPADRDLYLGLGGEVAALESTAQAPAFVPDKESVTQHDSTCTWQPREGFGAILDQRGVAAADLDRKSAAPRLQSVESLSRVCLNCRRRPRYRNFKTCRQCFYFPERERGAVSA